MRTRILFFQAWVFLCLAIVSGQISLAGEITNSPTVFNANIGGFLGTSYSVKLKDGVLFYTAREDGKETDSAKIVPTTTQWKEFHDAIDKLDVWQWQTNYNNYKVLDGTQWSLQIRFSGQNVEIVGDNCYPKTGGKPNEKPEFTDEFRKYLKAVGKLLGGEKFE